MDTRFLVKTKRSRIDGTGVFAASPGGNVLRFVNRSCDPNLYIRIFKRRVEFYAKRDVQVGEELTCDYGETQHEGTLPCRCGAARCREFL